MEARREITEILEMAYRQKPTEDIGVVGFCEFWADQIIKILRDKEANP